MDGRHTGVPKRRAEYRVSKKSVWLEAGGCSNTCFCSRSNRKRGARMQEGGSFLSPCHLCPASFNEIRWLANELDSEERAT